MARLDLFEKKLACLAENIIDASLKNRINQICENVEGMCNEQTLTMLNMAVTDCLEEGETYLEIGTWKGRTTVAALDGNNAQAIVIDPLTCDDSDVVFPSNMKKYNLTDRIDHFKISWQEYISENSPKNIGVFFYDGDHGEHKSYEGLNSFLPFVSNEAILIVDDTKMGSVSDDIDRWIKENKDNIYFHYDVDFWMGQSVIGYKR